MRKRRRYQAGSVVISRDGKVWLGQYRENGIKRTVTLGKRKGPERISKTEAETKLADIVQPLNSAANVESNVDPDITVKDYIEMVYFPHKRKGKWRRLTSESRTDSITLHVIGNFGDRKMRSMNNRVELQGWLDSLFTSKNSSQRMAYNTVDHLRWDLKAIFDLAVADGIFVRNPIYSGTILLHVHPDCPMAQKAMMCAEDVKKAIAALTTVRERVVFELIVLSGLRVSEVFGLRRGRVCDGYAKIAERVCRRDIDRPKSRRATRNAALSKIVQADLKLWLESSPDTGSDGWLFPSETMKTAIGSDNVMARHIRPKLRAVQLGWVDYRVMRRTHSSLMKEIKIDPKLVADQQGHGVDVNQNEYTQTSLSSRLEAVETLSAFVN
jgi:integrase